MHWKSRSQCMIFVHICHIIILYHVFRSKFVASEMPQAFQCDVILNAYRKVTNWNKKAEMTAYSKHIMLFDWYLLDEKYLTICLVESRELMTVIMRLVQIMEIRLNIFQNCKRDCCNISTLKPWFVAVMQHREFICWKNSLC